MGQGHKRSKSISSVGRENSIGHQRKDSIGGQSKLQRHSAEAEGHVRRNSNSFGDGNNKKTSNSLGRQKSSKVENITTKTSKLRSFLVRTLSTVVLIGTFIVFVWAGHVPLMFMVLAIQFTMVKELFGLARAHSMRHDEKLFGFRALQWYFFVVAAFFLYFRFIKNNLLVEVTSSAQLAHYFSWTVRHHTLVAFCLYTGGFVAFVLNLKKEFYMYQFKQFAWTHMILMCVFVPSSFFVSNIFEGLIWFLLPTSLVIMNDISAYVAGITFGRTPLIKLSPKKTWEGFIGGFLATMIAGWYLALLLSRYQWMICPRNDLSIGALTCQPSSVFVYQQYKVGEPVQHLPPSLRYWVSWLAAQIPTEFAQAVSQYKFVAAPMQFHAVVLGMFASLIAPFGGFFASGVKRAFRIKDFGDSIPGHGGMTDRMDCQIVMAMFSYMYVNHFVRFEVYSVATALSAFMKLSDRQQLEIFERLANMLAGEELISANLSAQIQEETTAALKRL